MHLHIYTEQYGIMMSTTNKTPLKLAILQQSSFFEKKKEERPPPTDSRSRGGGLVAQVQFKFKVGGELAQCTHPDR